MKCPYCLQGFHEKWYEQGLCRDKTGDWRIHYLTCPECENIVCRLHIEGRVREAETGRMFPLIDDLLVWPRGISRSPLPEEVPEEYAQDYREACLVLGDSPKASAALSRRCLQNILREEFKVKHSNLSDEIDEVLASKKLPSHLADSIDAIRNYGNFAAYPLKSEKAREIIDVEPGEAEWSLEVLESLFDFCFVQPKRIKAKRAALDKKLEDAGKPKMK